AEDGIRDRNVTGVQTCALPIVLLALFGVVEHRVGLTDLLEALLGVGVAGMAVGVELAGLFAVGLLDLVRARLLRDAEDRIEVLVEPVLLGHVMRLLPGASGWEMSGGTERGLPAGGGRQAPLRWCCTGQAGPRVPTRA